MPSLTLDCTAGNRMLWANKNPPNTVFTDRNREIQIQPDVRCDYRFLPFRDGVFSVIIFDPPHAARGRISREYEHQNPAAWSYYGWDCTDRELREGIRGASREFTRLTKRVCLKWSDVDHGEQWILGMMREWRPIHKRIIKYSRVERIASYWMTLVPAATDDNDYRVEDGRDDWGWLKPVDRTKFRTVGLPERVG
jgi:hypothetical protein